MNNIDMIYNHLQSHVMLVLVLIAITFDLFLGVMRAFKERKTNSSIGIDGMIRKASMIVCLFFLIILDFLIDLNLIGWLPEMILSVFKMLNIESIGISDVFALLFILFELLSILKNWTLIGLPMFRGVNDWVQNFLETFTDEMPSTNKNK